MNEPEAPELTSEQMDDLVVADVDDPAAWGEPIVVGPSKGPRRLRAAKHLDLAARLHVLSGLHRLGADAELTFAPTSGIDLIITRPSGVVATVEVKALTTGKEWLVSSFVPRPSHYFAFVWYASASDPTIQPDVYIVSAERLRRFIDEHAGAPIALADLDAETGARDAWHQLLQTPAA